MQSNRSKGNSGYNLVKQIPNLGWLKRSASGNVKYKCRLIFRVKMWSGTEDTEGKVTHLVRGALETRVEVEPERARPA